ncbi:hypothetical protein R1Y80_13230 [Streptomyces sp. JL1001]|uniref:DUF3558 domain-containing protein n=1 Tax=Streptomyces sp. JL1001 TaxID=3078227 RepID=A0AAU8KHG8_9ACTN|nr:MULTISPECIES: hypothetical protein [unclassified Streptomyces]
MVIGRRKASHGVVAVSLVGSLALGVVGCSEGSGAAKRDDRAVRGTQLCGGDAISAEAGKALKVITGSSRFEPSRPEDTVAHAARSLGDAYASPATDDGDICHVYAMDSAPSDRLEATWDLTWGPPESEPAPEFTVLPMGEQALAAPNAGIVRFACRSEKLPGPAPTHIRLAVERWSPEDPEGDPEKLTDAYATVAHSFALAMAKELRCENDGGLEPRPVLDPA